MEKEFFEEYGKGSPNIQFAIDPTPPPYPQDYSFNAMILEMANNFPFVRWLMYRHKEGKLQNVKDSVEKDWFTFLLQNPVDVLKFNNEEEDKFVKEYYKIPE